MTHWIDEAIAQQRDGFALQQAFYRDPEIFERDVKHVLGRQWLYVEHISAIPKTGDYVLKEIAGESIIIIRQPDGGVGAFYNVCRHRGSRVCLENEGNAKRLTCPYHAWSYALDGSLIGARKMPEGFDKADYPLHRCHVEVMEGLIFINLASGSPPSFAPIRDNTETFLVPHRLENAKIAGRELYPTRANWKLVIENFLECYHCMPCHPEYCAVNANVKLVAAVSEKAEAEYIAFWDDWSKNKAHKGFPADMVSSRAGDEPRSLENIVSLGSAANAASITKDEPPYAAYRNPIKEGSVSLTADGGPAAPLMGDFKEYDGGETIVSVGYLSTFGGANDYGVVFRFIPVAPELTDVEITWLVDANAQEGRDYDLERVKWMWHVTTVQDKTIVEDNQLGVNSRVYSPGPYSEIEGETHRFVRWYLAQISEQTEGARRRA